MSTRINAREIDESGRDFAVGFAVTQLNALPGDVTDPDNSRWQNAVIRSVDDKLSTVCAIDPSFVPKVRDQLTEHADRLEAMGQNISAGRLRGIMAGIIEPDQA